MNRFSAFSRMIPLATLFGGALLAGCAPVGRGIQRVGTNIHEQTIDYDRRVRNWFDSENEQAERERAKVPDTGYCYRTLGEVSCYLHPIAGQEERMVGLQVPEPMFDPLSYPIPEERPEAVYIDIRKEDAPAAIPAPLPVEVTEHPAPALTPQAAPEPAIAPQPEKAAPQGKSNAPRELMPVIK